MPSSPGIGAATLSWPDISFEAIVEQAIAGIYVIQDGRFVYANETWAAIAGYQASEVIGMSLECVVPGDFLHVVRSRIDDRLTGKVPHLHFITQGVHRDGHRLFLEVHGSRIDYRGRPAVMGIGIDVTDRVQAEEDLQHSREQLQALTAYTAAKLDDQRLRIAREVHDVLGGMLTSIKMDAARILRRADNTEVRSLTQGVLALTQQTIESVRQISESLHPSVLDHLDISVAITHELRRFSQRSGVAHEIAVGDTTNRMSPKRATAAFRIFQEGLTNVARHAGASHVSVVLRIEPDQMHLELDDDGCGFDQAQCSAMALGLLSMRERARDVGGELQIISRVGQGTRLRLRVPLL